MPILMTPLVLDRDLRQYDVSDSRLLIDVLIYVVYDADVEDVVVMISVVVVCDVDLVVIVVYVEYVVCDVVVVVIHVVKVVVLAANDEKARMNLRNLQVADDT